MFFSKKNMLIMFVIIALIIGMCGCDSQSMISFENDKDQTIIFSKGLKKHDEWLYFDNFYDNSVYRISFDGGILERLLDNSSIIFLANNYLLGYDYSNKVLKRMNVLDGTKIEFKVNGNSFILDGEWIYFSNNDDSNKLYKIKIDGSDLTKLNDDYTVQAIVFKDSIYYINNSNMKLYIIEKDGDGRQKLSSNDCYNFRIFSEKIFYSGLYDFYKVNHNGSGETLILENTDVMLSNYVDGWIYYTNHVEYRGKPYKMREDGTDNQKVMDSGRYYVNRNDENKLYKVSEDGTNDQKITDEWVSNYFIDGEYIYYNVSCSGVSNIVVALANKHNGEATKGDIKFIEDYFTQRNDLEGAIFRIKLDGTEKVQMTGKMKQ